MNKKKRKRKKKKKKKGGPRSSIGALRSEDNEKKSHESLF
jgi:hypothetical protein